MKNLSIAALAMVALVGCGGSGGSPFGASRVGTGANGGGAPQSTATFRTPAALQGSDTMYIRAVSGNGHIVGAVDASNQMMYWVSPSAAPIVVRSGPFGTVVVNSVNNAGQMVGSGIADGDSVALYWSSGSATPVEIPLPAGQAEAVANSINNAGQIVGYANAGVALIPYYWDSSTADALRMYGVLGGNDLQFVPLQIADNGSIFGTNNNTMAAVMWGSARGNAQTLALPAGATYFIGASNSAFAVNKETGEAGGGVNGAAIVPAFWTPPTETVNSPPFPAGYNAPVVLLGIGPNHESVGIAGTSGSFACLWTSPTTPFQNLNNLIPPGTGWNLVTGTFMLDDGSVIGQGVDPNSKSAWYIIKPK